MIVKIGPHYVAVDEVVFIEYLGRDNNIGATYRVYLRARNSFIATEMTITAFLDEVRKSGKIACCSL